MSRYELLAPRDPTSKIGRVWRLAEEITRRKARLATRSEVMDAYVGEGGNPNTASTQYSQWKKVYLQRRDEADTDLPGAASISGPRQLTVGPDGRLVIPAAMRVELGIAGAGTVIARVIDGELRLMPLALAVRRAQDAVRQFAPPGVSLADELIVERRAEAKRDEDG